METKASLNTGETDMSKAVEKNVKMLARAMDESRQLVGRQRIHRQLEACGEDGVSEDWLKEHEQDALAKLKDAQFYASFPNDSDDDGGAEHKEEDEGEEEEDVDNEGYEIEDEVME